jgi:hypothetical protein
VVKNLQSAGDVLVGFWPDDPVIAMLPGEPGYDGWVLEWTGRDPRVALEPYLRQMPSGWEVQPVNVGLLPRTAWGQGIILQFGNVEGFT